MMPVPGSRVLGVRSIIRAIASGFPRFPGILEECFSTNAVNFPQQNGIKEA